MIERKTTHDTFVITRDIAASPERVFQAFADPEKKAKWFKGPPGWVQGPKKDEFRIGGKASSQGGPPGQWTSRFECTYYDIVPNARIVYAYEMHIDDRKISVSLATIEIAPSARGAKLVLTEQGVFLDGYDDSGSRERGSNVLMDQLVASIAADSAA